MVDVCLVLEGSYPYVTGGVSAWAHGLIAGLPDVSFTVAHVRDEGHEQSAAYALPANAGLVHVDLDPDASVPHPGAHLGLPEARVYHAACTGSAAELARLAAAEHGRRFAVTEHGLAWREARWGIDGCKLARGADLLTGCKVARGIEVVTGCKLARGLDVVTGCKLARAGEARPFSRAQARRRADDVLALALRSYAEADAVTSVCGPNAAAQRRLGAPAGRSAVIPNAVATGPARGPARRGRAADRVRRPRRGRQGRGDVPARRARSSRGAAPAPASSWSGRPTTSRPTREACADLASRLGLDGLVTFTGETDPAPWFARLDVLALTSLSEAQPLVALEAMAAGVPVVATDVGGCREAIADAGLLTPAGDPHATARALLRARRRRAAPRPPRRRRAPPRRHAARAGAGPRRLPRAVRAPGRLRAARGHDGDRVRPALHRGHLPLRGRRRQHVVRHPLPRARRVRLHDLRGHRRAGGRAQLRAAGQRARHHPRPAVGRARARRLHPRRRPARRAARAAAAHDGRGGGAAVRAAAAPADRGDDGRGRAGGRRDADLAAVALVPGARLARDVEVARGLGRVRRDHRGLAQRRRPAVAGGHGDGPALAGQLPAAAHGAGPARSTSPTPRSPGSRASPASSPSSSTARRTWSPSTASGCASATSRSRPARSATSASAS